MVSIRSIWIVFVMFVQIVVKEHVQENVKAVARKMVVRVLVPVQVLEHVRTVEQLHLHQIKQIWE